MANKLDESLIVRKYIVEPSRVCMMQRSALDKEYQFHLSWVQLF